MSIGSFCLVLHGHLPYVLRHGNWPHGEDWLYEAAAETYLPLLSTIGECELLNGNPRITVGLTPILLEQLSHDLFKRGFERYLRERIERARSDHKEFNRTNELHCAYLAGRWERFYTELSEQFSEIGCDIPSAFAELAQRGLVQILTSSATHAYLPLLYEDSSIAGQLRSGMATSERILKFRPDGLWLPECAYRPPGPWTAPIQWGHRRDRHGIEKFIDDENLTHFFIENQLIEQSRSEWVDNLGWEKVDWEEASKYPKRGWRCAQEPVYVASNGMAPRSVMTFARDLQICEQVWSGLIGYPADGAYLEFHKKHGERRGLRYWKITAPKTDLGHKELYYPQDIKSKIHEHSKHFCSLVKNRLREYYTYTGRHGVVCACFDAELFGHWWFEGPQFLRDIILTMNVDPDIDLCTSSEYLTRHPPDKAVALPEGSWGDGGDHRVWTNERINWIWEVEYRCEAIFGKLTYNLAWKEQETLKSVLEKAARELLLMQASDWPFVIARDQAVDYGIKRFMQHASRFECLADIAEKLAFDNEYIHNLTEVEKFEIKDAEIHDVVFSDIDLNWWNV